MYDNPKPWIQKYRLSVEILRVICDFWNMK